MPWVEVFAAFVVCHLVGDYLFQTDWQATHKRGGLGPDRQSRRALVSHVATYTLAFVPALIWLADDIGAWAAVGTAALIAVPHLIEDDGRLVAGYMRAVKHTDPASKPAVVTVVDQTFHLVALFLTALLVGT
jgi:hypothetical protein